jgi:alkyl hydroperoxide reductase subunit AhpF
MAMPRIDVGGIPPLVPDGSSKDEVVLLTFVDDSVLSKQLISFVKAFSQETPHVSVDIQDWAGGKNEKMRAMHVDYAPCLVLTKGDFSRIKYYGVPDGYEVTPLHDAVSELYTSSPHLADSSKVALATVRRKANIKVFVLTTCTFCPIVARHAMRAAIATKTVTTEIIDSAVFTEMSQKHLVQGVPKVVLNDISDITGAVNETTFMEKLRDADHALIDSMFG